MHDVFVSGAGPAGSVAALELARAGLDVVLVDREGFPRHKICAGGLSFKSVRLLTEDLGLDLSSPLVQTMAPGGSIYYRYQKVGEVVDSASPLSFVSRYDFDDFLRGEAVKAGATFIPQWRVGEVDIRDGVVTGPSGERLQARHLIGADGMNGVTARTLRGKLPSNRGVGVAIEVEVPFSREAMRARLGSELFPELHFGVLDVGYGWVFPKRGRLTVGLGGLIETNRRLRARFEEFCERLELGVAWQDLPRLAYRLPFGGFVRRPARERLLLVGDAAGFAEPLLGEGIFYAMLSGVLAARAVIRARRSSSKAKASRDSDAASAYVHAMRGLVADFQAGVWLRNLAYHPRLEPLLMRTLREVPQVSGLAARLLAGEIGFRELRRRCFLLSPWVLVRILARRAA